MSHPIGFADYRSVVDYDIDRLGVEAYEWLLFSTSIVNRLVRSHGFVFFRIPFFLLVCWRYLCIILMKNQCFVGLLQALESFLLLK